MEFGVLGFNGVSSNDTNKQKWCESTDGLTHQHRSKTLFSDSATDSKLGKLSTDFSIKEQNILSFEDKTLQSSAFAFFQHPNSPYTKNAGYTGNSGGLNARMYCINGVKWPFTTSQWVELEQQALIYKYIIANEPIPSDLLIPIKRALESAAFCSFPTGLLRPNAYGWGPFHLGFSNNADPEPGRCRRTDGKKWRCSRDAVLDHKYCERHMNRGRQRSRKPVETHSGNSVSGATTNKTKSPTQLMTHPSSSSAVSNPLSAPMVNRNTTRLDFLSPTISLNSSNNTFSIAEDQEYSESASGSFAFLTTDHSRLNSTQGTSSVYGAYGSSCNDINAQDQSTALWPKMQAQPERTQLSISIPSAPADYRSSTSSPTGEKFTLSPLRLSREIDPLEMGLGRGKQPDLDLDPIRWDTSVGGPLGEALKTTSNNSMEHDKNLSALNLLSPTGVLRRTPVGSVNSSAGSSPRADTGNALENVRTFWDKISEF